MPDIEHAQDVLSGGLGEEWSINSCSSFAGSCFCVKLLCLFNWFFSFFFGFSCVFF